jgi:hypothetical protein
MRALRHWRLAAGVVAAVSPSGPDLCYARSRCNRPGHHTCAGVRDPRACADPAGGPWGRGAISTTGCGWGEGRSRRVSGTFWSGRSRRAPRPGRSRSSDYHRTWRPGMWRIILACATSYASSVIRDRSVAMRTCAFWRSGTGWHFLLSKGGP